MRRLTPLLLLTFILRIALAFRSDANIGTKGFNDDSFYIHTIANHLGNGEGMTIDGKHVTNGLQPLVALLYAPCYSISAPDRWLGLRLTFIITALIDCCSVTILYFLLKKHFVGTKRGILSPAFIGCLSFIFLNPIISQTTNGMETGLVVFLLLLSLYYYGLTLESTLPPTKLSVFLGVTLGLLVLARIDTVLLIVLLFAYECYRQKSFKGPLIFGSIAFLISLPWWLYNYVYFGSLLPTSGASEMLGGPSLSENIIRLGITLSDISIFIASLRFDTISDILKVLWVAIGYAIGMWIWIKRKSTLATIARPMQIIISLLLCFGALLALWYCAFFHASYFLPRYLMPLRIGLLLYYAYLLPVLWKEAKKQWQIVFSAGIVFALVFNLSLYANTFFLPKANELYQTGLWAKQHPAEVIGMQQSGVAGFVTDNVVNLDGKVNAEVLAAMKKQKRGAYIASAPITILADWKEFAEVLRAEAKAAGADFKPIDSIGLVTIYKRTALTTPAASQK